MKAILVPVEANDTIDSTLQTARLLARTFGSHVQGFAIGPTITPFLAADAIGGTVLYETDLKPDDAAVAEAKQLFERYFGGEAGGQGDGGTVSADWITASALDEASVGNRGRVYDVTVLGRPGSGASSPRMSTLEAALFESGRPVLIAPPAAPAKLGEVVALAWNRSAETARTVAFAMPLLMRARRIVVLATDGGNVIGPDGDRIAEYLGRHGLACEVVPVRKTESKSFGPAILEEAARVGSDLLIKGAYTQNRISQMIFGGASRHILAEAALPVFMAH